MDRSRIVTGIFTIAGLVAAVGVMAAPAAGARASGHHEAFAVIAGHLNNPRGLSPAPGGGLYLAEAGSGGGVCVAAGPEGETCLGLTGSFDLVRAGGVQRIVTGLISGSGPGGSRRRARCRCPVARTRFPWLRVAPGHGQHHPRAPTLQGPKPRPSVWPKPRSIPGRAQNAQNWRIWPCAPRRVTRLATLWGSNT